MQMMGRSNGRVAGTSPRLAVELDKQVRDACRLAFYPPRFFGLSYVSCISLFTNPEDYILD